MATLLADLDLTGDWGINAEAAAPRQRAAKRPAARPDPEDPPAPARPALDEPSLNLLGVQKAELVKSKPHYPGDPPEPPPDLETMVSVPKWIWERLVTKDMSMRVYDAVRYLSWFDYPGRSKVPSDKAQAIVHDLFDRMTAEEQFLWLSRIVKHGHGNIGIPAPRKAVELVPELAARAKAPRVSVKWKLGLWGYVIKGTNVYGTKHKEYLNLRLPGQPDPFEWWAKVQSDCRNIVTMINVEAQLMNPKGEVVLHYIHKDHKHVARPDVDLTLFK